MIIFSRFERSRDPVFLSLGLLAGVDRSFQRLSISDLESFRRGWYLLQERSIPGFLPRMALARTRAIVDSFAGKPNILSEVRHVLNNR